MQHIGLSSSPSTPLKPAGDSIQQHQCVPVTTKEVATGQHPTSLRIAVMYPAFPAYRRACRLIISTLSLRYSCKILLGDFLRKFRYFLRGFFFYFFIEQRISSWCKLINFQTHPIEIQSKSKKILIPWLNIFQSHHLEIF